MITQSLVNRLALGAALVVGACTVAQAQDSGPLIDALVRKGILTDQEGEELRTELVRDFGYTSPGKVDVATAVTRLRIVGDARVRYQYDNEQPNPTGSATDATRLTGDRDRNRFRYRLRFGMTADLGPKWSASFRMETANGATSTNADLGSATDNFSKDTDNVYFGQVYINYKDIGVLGSDAIDVRVGKLPHKFYTPGVNGFWIDTDVNFEGAAEEIVYNDVGLQGSFLSLRAGQFILNNNAANAGSLSRTGTTTSGGTTTATIGNTSISPSLLWMAQLEYATKTWKVAPTFVVFAAPSDHDRAVTFSYPAAATPAQIATARRAAYATAQASDTANYSDLTTFLLPAEYMFAVGGKPMAVYATYGYNFDGEERARRLANSASADDESHLYNVGVRYGENRLAGDYQLVGEYRYVGNGSYSSLLLDSDFNAGLLNGEGFILSGIYSFTDAITGTITYFNSFNIEQDRILGASRGNGFGQAQVLQIDLSAKF